MPSDRVPSVALTPPELTAGFRRGESILNHRSEVAVPGATNRLAMAHTPESMRVLVTRRESLNGYSLVTWPLMYKGIAGQTLGTVLVRSGDAVPLCCTGSYFPSRRAPRPAGQSAVHVFAARNSGARAAVTGRF